jgi:pimeloyl-ACP methyl ester carboxylesterase
MQAWPGLEPYARRVALPSSGLSVYLCEAGRPEASPAVLVHGLGDEADTWRHIVEPLSARYRVLAPDLPGFGRSDKPRRAYTVPFFCQVLLELMDLFALHDATLIGHSLGAIVVQQFALRHADRVRSLVLIGGTVLARAQAVDWSLLLFLLPGLGKWMYTRLRKDPRAAYATLRGYYADLEQLPQAEQDFMFQRVNERVWSDDQRRAYLSTMRHLIPWMAKRQRGLETELAQLQVPTLVLWGQRDRIAGIENGRALASVQPAARLVIVPEAGHMVHQEQPAALLDAILADDRLIGHPA